MLVPSITTRTKRYIKTQTVYAVTDIPKILAVPTAISESLLLCKQLLHTYSPTPVSYNTSQIDKRLQQSATVIDITIQTTHDQHSQTLTSVIQFDDQHQVVTSHTTPYTTSTSATWAYNILVPLDYLHQTQGRNLSNVTITIFLLSSQGRTQLKTALKTRPTSFQCMMAEWDIYHRKQHRLSPLHANST
jgi:hypothetical protein